MMTLRLNQGCGTLERRLVLRASLIYFSEGGAFREKEDMDRFSVAKQTLVRTLLSAVWVGARFWGVDFLPELSRYVSIASTHPPPPSFPPARRLILEYYD